MTGGQEGRVANIVAYRLNTRRRPTPMLIRVAKWNKPRLQFFPGVFDCLLAVCATRLLPAWLACLAVCATRTSRISATQPHIAHSRLKVSNLKVKASKRAANHAVSEVYHRLLRSSSSSVESKQKTKMSQKKTVAFKEGPTKAKENKPPPCPASLRPFVGIYDSIPKIHVPFTDLDVSLTVISFLVLSGIRLVLFRVLVQFGWPSNSKMTLDSAGSLASILHSVVLCYGTLMCLITHPKYVPSAKLTAAPLWWQEAATALLEICTGYMIHDAFFLIRDCHVLGLQLSDFEMLCLGHHLATSLYMISARVVGAGHLSAMMMIFCGEISNPFMNALFVTRFAIKLSCCNSTTVKLLHTIIEPTYAFVYAYFRLLIGPLAATHLTHDLLIMPHGRKNVPIQLSIVWVALVWAVIYGSGPFIQEAVNMLSDGLNLHYHEDYDYGERYQHEEL